jgi:hypothetical protein
MVELTPQRGTALGAALLVVLAVLELVVRPRAAPETQQTLDAAAIAVALALLAVSGVTVYAYHRLRQRRY